MSRFDAVLNARFTPTAKPVPKPEYIEPVDEINELNEISPLTNGLLSFNSFISYRDAGKKPFLTSAGELIIPRCSPSRYHWWKEGGQSLRETLQELGASSEVVSRYVGRAGLHD